MYHGGVFCGGAGCWEDSVGSADAGGGCLVIRTILIGPHEWTSQTIVRCGQDSVDELFYPLLSRVHRTMEEAKIFHRQMARHLAGGRAYLGQIGRLSSTFDTDMCPFMRRTVRQEACG